MFDSSSCLFDVGNDKLSAKQQVTNEIVVSLCKKFKSCFNKFQYPEDQEPTINLTIFISRSKFSHFQTKYFDIKKKKKFYSLLVIERTKIIYLGQLNLK